MRPLRLLLVEDSEHDAELLIAHLRRGGFDPQHERIDSAEALNAALDRQPWDLVIADYTMPGFSGTAALSILRARGFETPFIFVSGTIGEDTAVDAMKVGAYDYLIKPVDLEELELSLQHALRQRQLELDRRQLEQWLAREVAVRTRDLEERTAAIEEVALDALAAAGDWPGADVAIQKLAAELDAPPSDVAAEVKRRRR